MSFPSDIFWILLIFQFSVKVDGKNSCSRGFNYVNGVCMPHCEEHCVNGLCFAPNECSCFVGYTGRICDKECDDGFWGFNCRRACDCGGQSCNKTNGVCLKVNEKTNEKLNENLKNNLTEATEAAPQIHASSNSLLTLCLITPFLLLVLVSYYYKVYRLKSSEPSDTSMMTEGDDFHLYTKLNIDKAGNVSEQEKFYETVKRKSQRQGRLTLQLFSFNNPRPNESIYMEISENSPSSEITTPNDCGYLEMNRHMMQSSSQTGTGDLEIIKYTEMKVQIPQYQNIANNWI